jgi:hypothetical protein
MEDYPKEVHMATYTQRVNKINDRVIGVVEQIDGLTVNATSAAARWIGDLLPDELPGAGYVRNLPKPDEYVKAYWDFVERLVRTQKGFTNNMLKAFQPLTGKIWRQSQVRKAA